MRPTFWRHCRTRRSFRPGANQRHDDLRTVSLAQATQGDWPDDLYRRVRRQRRSSVRYRWTRGSRRAGTGVAGAGRPASDNCSSHRQGLVNHRSQALRNRRLWPHSLSRLARRRTRRPRASRVGTFAVPNGSAWHPGNRRTRKSLGMRATGSHDVEYTDVEIPAENVLELVDRSGGPAGTIVAMRRSPWR